MSARPPMLQALEPALDPAWVVHQHGFDPLRDGSRQSRFAISNGFLGVPGGRAINRGGCGVIPPLTYVAGLFDTLGAEQPFPGLVPAPDWLRVQILLPNGPLVPHPDNVSFHSRTLDLRRGLLLTEGHLARAPGVAIRLRVLRFVSLDNRAVGVQLIRLEVETGETEVTFEASFDGLAFGLMTEQLDQDLGVWRTNTSGKRLAIAAGASLAVDGKDLQAQMLGPFKQAWTWKARPGQVACFDRSVAVFRSDAEDRDPGKDAHETLWAARTLGWRAILARHETAWLNRWDRSDVEVEGDEAAQQALRFAAYHLNGAANPHDERISIGARALTGADYRGHVFWDTEIFLLPFYTLTWPEAARALLMYRFHTLDGARAKAARIGWRGAMYAWESADTGAETTPEHAIGPDRKVVDILCGTQEQHISADIAYAVWQYWSATGDEAFLLDAGAEIMLETARFWASRAIREPDGMRHIRGVIGPDEYHETIDDNAFTNVMARWNIRRAIEVAALMREHWPERWGALSNRIGLNDAELQEWSGVADEMATGLDPRTGLFEQFEGYFALEDVDLTKYEGRSVPMDVVLGRERTEASQVVKQADVVALLGLLPEEFPGEAGAANFAYYAPRCSHGSSLSRAMHGLVAARLGRDQMALKFFRQTSAIDLADTHAALDGGVHIAAPGGIWMTAVLGFAGLSLREDGLALNPHLPKGWAALSFSVQWRGRELNIAVRHVDPMVEATLRSGEHMTVEVDGTAHELHRGAPLLISGKSAKAA
jgi:trehalose/maltose hydrolase-like predicted phosphorylase